MATQGRLREKIALITGAAQGIGRATALLFAAEGARLALLDKNEAGVTALAAEITAAGGTAIAAAADITRKADIDGAVSATHARLGPVSILVNNAGVTLTRPFVETTPEDLDVLVGVNLKGLMLMSQSVVPDMAGAGGGAIVHDASNAGLVGRPWQPLYGATKAGVVSLTKSMALALAKDNIRVNCICPGSIDTPMLRDALAKSGDFAGNWRKTERVIPLGRIGRADDIAQATLFLASDAAAYITGVALPVDGGRTAGIAEVSLLDGA